jgi:hypothetical protein
MSASSETVRRDLIAGTWTGNYPVLSSSRAGTMLIPKAINTTPILSIRVHLRQIAFRSVITFSQ